MDFFGMNEDWLKSVGQIYSMVPECQPNQLLLPELFGNGIQSQSQPQPQFQAQEHTQAQPIARSFQMVELPEPAMQQPVLVARKTSNISNLTISIDSRDLEDESSSEEENILSLQTSPTSEIPMSPTMYEIHDIAGTTAYASKNMTPVEKQIVKIKRRIRNCEAAKRSRSKREAKIKQMQMEHGQMMNEIKELRKVVEYLKSENQRLIAFNSIRV
mmetsp:Transcript_19722/g.33818  ORF Transcript_19722/g.33818 Transcript_19722/m.33818 type:complete len:215 (+) Transcript_19722:131-775(+)